MDATLQYLQSKLSKEIQISYKKGELIVDFYKNGEHFRQDKIWMQSVDYSRIEWLEDEGDVVLRCKRDNSKCIDRRLFTKKIRDQYSRTKFPITGNETDRAGFIEALTHLAKLEQVPNYERTEPFE